MKVSYREAEPQDLTTIVGFQIAMALETENLTLDPTTIQYGVAGVFEQPHRGTYHVCSLNRQLVGSLLIIPEWSDWRNGTVWWIHSLYIKPECRGQKLFSGFYNYVQHLSQETGGVCGLRLYVDARNALAQAVYRKLGMKDDHYRMFEKMW